MLLRPENESVFAIPSHRTENGQISEVASSEKETLDGMARDVN
jgi:hypothetical protein